MTKEEFGIVVKALRSAYRKQDFLANREDVEVWYGFLSDLDYKAAVRSVQQHIVKSKWPPTIAEIREGAVDMPNLPNAAEAWAMVRKAASNGLYEAEFEFKRLPVPVQRAVGDCRVIHNMALMDEYALSSHQSHFQKVYGIELERAKEHALIPERLRALIADTCEKLPG